MTNSIKSTTLVGMWWSFIENIAGSGITFIVTLILARILTPQEFGVIGIINIFIVIFNSIADSGFSNALIRKINVSNDDYNTVFILNIVLGVFLFFILFICAPYISYFFENNELVSLTRVMGLIVIINAFGIIQRTILTKRIDFRTQTKVSVIASIGSGIVGIGMAIMNFGVWSLVGQQIIRQVLSSSLLWIFNNWRPTLEFSITSFKELFGFGWKLLVSGLINNIWEQLYTIVIGKCYTTESLGQYTRARGFTDIVSINLTSVIQRVSFPVLSSIQDERERMKQAYKKIIKSSMFITFVLMLGLAAIAKSMVLVLVGDKWLPSVEYIQIICFSSMLYPLHAINLNMLQVQGRSDLFLYLEILKKIIAFGPLMLGVFIGIKWMLWGSVLSGLIAYYLNSYYSGKLLQYSIKEQIVDIMPSFLLSILMAVIVYSISFISISPFIILPLQLILGAIVIVVLGEVSSLQEYKEIKGIFLSILTKIKNG